MPVDRTRAWLTPDAYERIGIELVRLRTERVTASCREPADAERRERRIRTLN